MTQSPAPAPHEQQECDTLLRACNTGDVITLHDLLQTPSTVTIALSRPMKPYNLSKAPVLNLLSLLLVAARAGHISIVEEIIAFGKQCSVAEIDIINRDSCVAAIEGADSLGVFRAFVNGWPEAAKHDMGHLGDPLSYAIAKHRTELVKFLLEKGADPNRRCCRHDGPGHHLEASVRWGASPEVVEALLEGGATIQCSGATRAAVKMGSIDALALLVRYGADVNETLSDNMVSGDRARKEQEASETPLHVAVSNDQLEVAKCLMANGADASIQDKHKRTPVMVAQELGKENLVNLLTS